MKQNEGSDWNHQVEGQNHVSGKETSSDRWNICLLIVLHYLQMLVIEIASALSLILQSRGITYAQQAELKLMCAPLAFKLLYAPLIDSLHIPKLGKRKSWIIPSQMIMGVLLFITSFYIEDWISSASAKKINILPLTIMFFVCILFSTSQSIAIDAWSLTLLKKENLGHAATGSCIGTNLAILFGFVAFILTTSEHFCNTWLRSTPQSGGILSISSYLAFWSVVMLVVSTLLLLFKREGAPHDRVTAENETRYAHREMSVIETYKIVYQILKLKPVRILIFIFLTCKIAFWTKDLYSLKLIDTGVSPDQLAILSIPVMLFQIGLPFISKRYLIGSQCIDCFIFSHQFLTLYSSLHAVLVYYVPKLMYNGKVTSTFYLIYFFMNAIDNIAMSCMTISAGAFFAKVSDPRFGGTYLTIFNTMRNLGSKMPHLISLWLVDHISYQSCKLTGNATLSQLFMSSPSVPVNSTLESVFLHSPSVNFTLDPVFLHSSDISHVPTIVEPIRKISVKYKKCIDGFYIEIIFGVVFGLLWMNCGGRKLIRKMQQSHPSEWLVKDDLEQLLISDINKK